MAYLFENIDTERVFLVGGFNEIGQCEFLVGFLLQDRCIAIIDSFLEYTIESAARGLGFQTTFLAAMTEYLVIKRVDMAEFSREARAPFVEVSIDKNADTKPPTDVKKQDILLSFGTSLHEFSEIGRAHV